MILPLYFPLLRSVKSRPSIIIFDKKSKHLICWKPKTKSMTRIHEFNEEMKKRVFFTSVSIGNNVYVLLWSSLYRLKYSDDTATWETMNGLDGRHGPSPPAVVHSEKIYVVGTEGGRWLLSKSVSKYDPSLNRWEILKDKTLDTKDSAVVASKGFIYNIGGIVDGFVVTDRVERLNVASQTWDEVAPMNEKRHYASAVECNEKIIVAGGRNDVGRLNSVEKYDPDVNQWTIMKPMMKRRCVFGLHSIEGKLFAVGGDYESRTIEKYGSSKGRWEIIDLGLEIKFLESVSVKT